MKKTLRTCDKGHQYYKSSDCPVCPVCASEDQTYGFLSLLSAPARRALENNGIRTPGQLSQMTEKEVLKLHGMGKASIPVLKKIMQADGLSFKPGTVKSKP